MYRFVPLMILLSLLVCCSELKPAPPTLTPERAEFVSAQPAGMVIRVHCKAHNPNKIALPIRSVQGELSLGSTPLGGVSASSMATLAANADTPVSFDVSVPWANVMPALNATKGSNDIPYTVKGTAHFEAAGIDLSTPFSTTGSVAKSTLLSSALRSMGINHPGLPSLFPNIP